MSGLVIELQQAAMDGRITVGDVLRKALVLTKKLRIPDLEQWISCELDGYGAAELPAYRTLSVQLKVWNPYHGWQPLFVEDKALANALSTCHVGQPLGQLEGLVGKDSGSLQLPFSPADESMLMSSMKIPLRPMRLASRTQVQGIVEAVRNQILKWALDLEAKGVVGEGMTFTAQEREAAHQVTNITNNIGSISNSQLQQASPHASQQQTIQTNTPELLALVEMLSKASLHELSDDETGELRAEIATLRAQVQSPKPKTTVVHEGLKSVRAILERAAGSMLTSEVLPAVIAVMHRLSI